MLFFSVCDRFHSSRHGESQRDANEVDGSHDKQQTWPFVPVHPHHTVKREGEPTHKLSFPVLHTAVRWGRMAPCTSRAREKWQKGAARHAHTCGSRDRSSWHFPSSGCSRDPSSSQHPSRPSPCARPEREGTHTKSSRLRRDHRLLMNERGKMNRMLHMHKRTRTTQVRWCYRHEGSPAQPAQCTSLTPSGRSRGWARASAPSLRLSRPCDARSRRSGPCPPCRRRSTASPDAQSTKRSRPTRASSCSCQ